jgi:hypothetical protein
VALVEALLERGADRDATDQYGCNALHIAMRAMFRDVKFARGPAAALYELLAPAYVDVKASGRLVRIDRHLSEYFVFQTFWALFKSRFTHLDRTTDCAMDTKALLDAWEGLPESIVRAARNKRQHLSNVLSRNELERDYVYNRSLFKRMAHGWYQLNPALEVRYRSDAGDESWRPVFAALNLPLIKEVASHYVYRAVDQYLAAAGLPPSPAPVVTEREAARLAQEAQHKAHQERALKQSKHPWGTPQARLEAYMELQRQIDLARAGAKKPKDE